MTLGVVFGRTEGPDWVVVVEVSAGALVTPFPPPWAAGAVVTAAELTLVTAGSTSIRSAAGEAAEVTGVGFPSARGAEVLAATVVAVAPTALA